jgi:hypothetical protein
MNDESLLRNVLGLILIGDVVCIRPEASSKYSPGPLRFQWPLQQFGDPSVVSAAFWKWNLSPVRFLQDIGPGNHAFASVVNISVNILELDAPVSTVLQHFGV